MSLRLLWFLLMALLFAGTLVAIARVLGLGSREGKRAALCSSALLASVPILLTLQMGNFALAAFCLGLLAILAFERGRALTGGALLGFATASKLFPGLLIVYLLGRRQYRQALATVAFVFLFAAAAYVLFGAAPYRAFFGFELPRLVSGSAFSWMDRRESWFSMRVLASNLSIFAIPLKMKALGLTKLSMANASLVAFLYGIALLAGAWIAGRRAVMDQGMTTLLVPLALLNLGALRSPFTPDPYGLIGTVWLICLQVCREPTDARTVGVFLPAWLLASFVWPIGKDVTGPSVTFRLWASLFIQAFVLFVSVRSLLGKRLFGIRSAG